MRKYYRYSIWFCIKMVWAISGSDGEIALRQVDLTTCQTIAKNLITMCVKSLDPDPKVCTPLYASYVACITGLNSPRQLVYKKSYDDYPLSAYSPCGYEISHLILADTCNKNISDGLIK